MGRKPISNKLRFEVFKRDNFTCQYCGRMAPDVILQVDHINPVSKGGTNDILNLVTSCFECNNGKGARKLNENQELKKQQERLKELNEKRAQLEMLIEWKKELEKLELDQVKRIEELFTNVEDIYFTNSGIQKIKSLIKKYGFNEVYESAVIALNEYDFKNSFGYISKICANRAYQKKHPEMVRVNYLFKILKNRKIYLGNYELFKLKKVFEENFVFKRDFDALKTEFATVENYTKLRNFLKYYYSLEEI
ncbi:MAG: HNH endonuclease [Lachnospiraceae bacterium]|nr:HNH endonuclease [Lachnospiraceae bacterium]